MAIKVLIADDHPLLRQGLVGILSRESDIVVVGEAGDGREAVAMAAALQPDVVVMDISMPRGGGLGATRKIQELYPSIGVIILTIHDDDQYLYELVRAGAKGYLMKDAAPDLVVEAIRKVYRGKPYLPPDLLNKVLGEFQRMRYGGPPTVRLQEEVGESRGAEALTQREMDILEQIVNGLSNAEIGEELFISEKTVKNHITNILRKLGLTDRTQAAVYALHHGLVEVTQAPAGRRTAEK